MPPDDTTACPRACKNDSYSKPIPRPFRTESQPKHPLPAIMERLAVVEGPPVGRQAALGRLLIAAAATGWLELGTVPHHADLEWVLCRPHRWATGSVLGGSEPPTELEIRSVLQALPGFECGGYDAALIWAALSGTTTLVEALR